MLLGQEVATPTTIIGAFIVVCLTMLSIVGWMIRHVFVTTIPDMAKVYSEGMATQAATYTGTLTSLVTEAKGQRESNDKNLLAVVQLGREEAMAERRQCAEQFTGLHTALVGIVAAMREEREVIIATVNQHTTTQCSLYRHEIKDMVNAAVLGRDAWLAKQSLVNPQESAG